MCLFRNYDFLHGLCRSDDVDAAQRTIGGCYIAPDKVENAECHIALDAAIARHTHGHIGSRHVNGGFLRQFYHNFVACVATLRRNGVV